MPFLCIVAGSTLAALLFSCASHEPSPSVADNQTKAPALGSHAFKVSTKNPEAQKAFNRGLTLAYSFNHRIAEAQFAQAAELDPNLAMAWWGVALVNGPHINFPMVPPDNAAKAWQALGKAQALAAQASPLNRH
jgi:hypothetical protein